VITVNIPESVKPVIEQITEIPAGDFEALLAALSNTQPSLKAEKIAAHAQAALPNPIPNLPGMLGAITNMITGPGNYGVSVNEFASAVVSSVEQRLMFPLRKKPIDRALLEGRLVALFSVKSLILSARANDVQHQYGSLFSSARIISDMRTVFDPEDSQPSGALIVHNLKITSFRGGEFEETYFALDNADLVILRKVLDRAEAKTASLESVIAKTGLKYFESK
jgi:hypothetical protein